MVIVIAIVINSIKKKNVLTMVSQKVAFYFLINASSCDFHPIRKLVKMFTWR